jgi:hypothetical protein
MGLDLGGIGVRIAIFDQDVAADRPSEFPEPLAEILKITLCVRIVLGDPQQYRDPPHPGHGLLRARGEGAHDRRAAEKGDELTPPHVLLSIQGLHPSTPRWEIPRCASQQTSRPNVSVESFASILRAF